MTGLSPPLAEGTGWRWVAPLAAGLIGVAALLPSGAVRALELTRDALASGELWRIATCHLVHFSPWHALRDASLLLVVAVVAGRRDARSLGVSVLAGVLLVPAAVLILEPGIGTYRGASGLDAAAVTSVSLALLADRSGRRTGRLLGGAGLLVLILLTAYEAIAGRSIRLPGAVGGTVPVAWSAHLGGLLAGVVGWAWDPSRRGQRGSPAA